MVAIPMLRLALSKTMTRRGGSLGSLGLLVLFGCVPVVTAACSSGSGSRGRKADDGRSSSPSASASSSAKASCNMIAVAGECDEYAKDDPLDVAKGRCEGFKGTYALAACPADGLVGTCVAKNDELKKYYVTKDALTSFAPDEARRDCESDLLAGKFTPVPNPPRKPVPEGGAASSAPSASSAGLAPAASSRATQRRR